MESSPADRITATAVDLRVVLILVLGLWQPWFVLVLAGLAFVVIGARLLTSWTPQTCGHDAGR
jgi:hypothetical protein